MSDFGTVPGAGQPWKQQYDFNTEAIPSDLTWTTANQLPVTIGKSQAIVTKNRVYLLGGYINDSRSNAVHTAVINENGTLGEWVTDSPLPGTVTHSHTIVTKNRVYLLGGDINGDKSSIVYTAIINEDGTLGEWVMDNPLPTTVGWSQAVVTKNRVYLLGGWVNGKWSNVIHTAIINENGALGEWSTTDPLPANIMLSQAIVTRNRVYLAGGLIDDNWSNAVYTACINEDGTLGAWSVTSSLPDVVSNSQVIVTKNRVFLLGGCANNCESNIVYTATINEDGTLENWVTSNILLSCISCSQVIITKGKVYLLGGLVCDDYSDEVYVADLPGGLNDYSEFY